MRVSGSGGARKIVLGQDPPVGNHRPAVNVLFDSVAPIGRRLVAVIMTGMGSDGTEGMKKIKAEEEQYVPLPKIYEFKNDREKEILLNRNFKRVNQEVEDMVKELLGMS